MEPAKPLMSMTRLGLREIQTKRSAPELNKLYTEARIKDEFEKALTTGELVKRSFTLCCVGQFIALLNKSFMGIAEYKNSITI